MMNLGLLGGLIVLIAVIAGLFILVAWAMGMVSALALFFILTSLLMILVVLIQRPRGGGLSGAFGGAGGSAQAAFGAKTGDMLTWVTVMCFAAFLTLSVCLTWTIHSNQQIEPPELLSPPDQDLPEPPQAAPTTEDTDTPIDPADSPSPTIPSINTADELEDASGNADVPATASDSSEPMEAAP